MLRAAASRYSPDARMSEIGAKSSAKAAMARRMVASLQGSPVSAASTAAARFGMGAMPPKAIRALATMPSSTWTTKAPQTAEMSWSKRLESFQARSRSGWRGTAMASTNSPGARSWRP